MAEPRRSARNRTVPYDVKHQSQALSDLYHKILKFTPEEKKTAMTQVRYRQASFDDSWKYHNSAQLSAAKMAEACLYYTGKGDKVTCPYCRVFIKFWDEADDPLEEHRKHAKGRCQFLNTQLDSQAGSEEMDTSSVKNSDDDILDACPQPEKESGPNDSMRDWENRMDTFDDWPEDSKKTPFELFAAGFYNIRSSTDPLNKDRVKCFACFVEIRQWEAFDDPLVEHAKHSPICPFVIKEKGQFFIDCVQNREAVKDLKNRLTKFAAKQGIPQSEVQEYLKNNYFLSREEMRDAVLALGKETVGASVPAQDEEMTDRTEILDLKDRVQALELRAPVVQ